MSDSVGDADVHISRDGGRATKPGSDTKVICIIQTVANETVTKAFYSSAFYTAIEPEI